MIKNNYYYNNKKGILLVFILFLIYILIVKYNCNCVNPNKYCYRKESYGIQINHAIFFMFLGIFFPSYFYTFVLLGIIWEFFEYLIHIFPSLFNLMQGCMINNNYPNIKQKKYLFFVYKDEEKPLNIIDSFFNIKNSKTHLWHHSIAEIIINIIFFIIGKSINKYYL